MLMLENATPLPVKAAGGVRTYDEAVEMIKLGVKRIGTSGAKAIAMEIQMWDTNFTIKSNMKRVCSL
jgi:deoxyribose-phosphate aldolase